MPRTLTANPVQEFVGSAHLFSSALTEVLQNKLLREAGGLDLSFSQINLLQLLAVARTQTIGELAAFQGISNAAASKTVDKLVRTGWVSRTTAEKDRRVAHVSLTPQARHLLAEYDRKRRRKLQDIFRSMSPEELQHMAQLMDHITVGIINHSARAEDICLRCGIYFREKCPVRDLGGSICLYRKHGELRRNRRSPSAR